MTDILPDKPVKKFREGELDLKKLRGKINRALKKYKYPDVEPDTEGLFTDDVYIDKQELRKKKEKGQPMNITIKGRQYHPIIGRICNMVNSNITPVIFIVGQQQFGKSKTAHYIADILHNEIKLFRGSYEPKNQLIYNDLEYLLASAEFTRMAKVIDEAEEHLNTQQRWEEFVKMVAGDIRTQSKRQNLNEIITPTFKHIAPQVRKHVNIMINMTGRRMASVQAIEVKHNKIGSRGYDQKFINYPTWRIPKVSKKKIKKWERIEDQFKGTYSLQNLRDGLDELIEEKEKEDISTL